MLYHLHELNRTLLNPLVAWSGAASRALSSPDNWLSRMPGMDRVAAGYELLYRLGKDYEKPAFNITSVVAHGREAPVVEERAIELPFCNLLRFKRCSDDPKALEELRTDPIVLVVATRCPVTTRRCCATRCARCCAITKSGSPTGSTRAWCRSRLDRFISTITSTTCASSSAHVGGAKAHVISVCQPTVPVLAAVSLMASAGEPTPKTLTLMGGPIDSAQMSDPSERSCAACTTTRGSRRT